MERCMNKELSYYEKIPLVLFRLKSERPIFKNPLKALFSEIRIGDIVDESKLYKELMGMGIRFCVGLKTNGKSLQGYMTFSIDVDALSRNTIVRIYVCTPLDRDVAKEVLKIIEKRLREVYGIYNLQVNYNFEETMLSLEKNAQELERLLDIILYRQLNGLRIKMQGKEYTLKTIEGKIVIEEEKDATFEMHLEKRTEIDLEGNLILWLVVKSSKFVSLEDEIWKPHKNELRKIVPSARNYADFCEKVRANKELEEKFRKSDSFKRLISYVEHETCSKKVILYRYSKKGDRKFRRSKCKPIRVEAKWADEILVNNEPLPSYLMGQYSKILNRDSWNLFPIIWAQTYGRKRKTIALTPFHLSLIHI